MPTAESGDRAQVYQRWSCGGAAFIWFHTWLLALQSQLSQNRTPASRRPCQQIPDTPCQPVGTSCPRICGPGWPRTPSTQWKGTKAHLSPFCPCFQVPEPPVFQEGLVSLILLTASFLLCVSSSLVDLPLDWSHCNLKGISPFGLGAGRCSWGHSWGVWTGAVLALKLSSTGIKPFFYICTPLCGSVVKESACNAGDTQEIWVWSLGWEDPLEKEMATHSSSLAWRFPWTEEPGRL